MTCQMFQRTGQQEVPIQMILALVSYISYIYIFQRTATVQDVTQDFVALTV